MSKKCTLLWREAHFQVKMLKALGVRTTFGRSDLVSRFVAFPKTIASVGHLKRICKDAFRLAGAVQETCSSEMLGGQGADFLREVAFSSIRYVDFLRWFCVTGAALRMTWHLFFRGRRNTFDRWSGKIAQCIGTRPSALHSTFHFWRKSRRIAPFLMLSSLKIQEVSQNCFVLDVLKFKIEEVSKNCFVLDVVNIEKWRSLADLLRFWCCQLWKIRSHAQLPRFWCCQVQNLRMSRRIARFSILQIDW